MVTATLHLMCGKIASGKSTLAKTLAVQHRAILLSEDKWLASLYPGAINSVTDYTGYSLRVRSVLGPLVVDMLESGVSVVLDFPAKIPSPAASGCWAWQKRHECRTACTISM